MKNIGPRMQESPLRNQNDYNEIKDLLNGVFRNNFENESAVDYRR